MNPEVTYSEAVTQRLRLLMIQERQVKRDNIVNSRRGILGEFQKNSTKTEEVVNVANHIKKKGKITEDNLRFLRQAFIENEENINAFMGVEGALHAVVGELSGTNSSMQLAAAECLVNLTLGNEKCCYKIAKMSGAYLILHLEGMNNNLKNISVWALGNLLGSDERTWNLLKSQGILSHYLAQLQVPELSDNVVYGLAYYVKTGVAHKIITSDEAETISKAVLNLNKLPQNILWLIYLLSCAEISFNSSLIMNELCQTILLNFEEYDVILVIYSIRTLANLLYEDSGCICKDLLTNYEKFSKFYETCEKIFGNAKFCNLVIELSWLIGNILNHSSTVVQEAVLNRQDAFKHFDILYKAGITVNS